MRFRATKKGFMTTRIYPGDEFEAPEGFKASWAEPVEEKKPDKVKKPASRKKKKSSKSD